MKVYVVTEGEYSSYHIEAIFTDEDKAWKCAMLQPYRQVEEYEVDSVDVSGEPVAWFEIDYDFKEDSIRTIEFAYKDKPDEIIVSQIPCWFEFNIRNTVKTFKDFVAWREWKCPPVFLKIARDRFAKYMYEQGKSREELIEQSKKDCEEYVRKRKEKIQNSPYIVHYTTSSATERNPVNIKVEGVLNELIKEGSPLPSYGDLVGMILQARKDVEKKDE